MTAVQFWTGGWWRDDLDEAIAIAKRTGETKVYLVLDGLTPNEKLVAWDATWDAQA